MFRWVKKYFVPHKHNDFKPHVFRGLSAFIIFLLILSSFLIAVSGRFLPVGLDLTAIVLPKVLVDYANENRATKSYGHLAINPILEKAAQLKANHMAENGYFAHKSPDGKTPWYWFREVGYDFSFAGENLAVNFNDSVDVSNAWMNSPGHRDNILNSNFSEIGIATAEGMYQGRRTTFVVQLFGRPAEKDTILTPKTTVSPKKTEIIPKTPTVASSVLSESVSSEVLSQNGTSDMFVSVEKKSVATTVAPQVKYSTFWQRVVASPEKTLSIVYSLIAFLIIVGLSSMIFVEFRKHNIRMMLLGVGLLIVMFGLLYIYKSIIISPLLIV